MAKSAAERFGGPQAEQRDVQAVKESLHRTQGDPEPGHLPADIQEAVRQDQRGSAQTPVVTQTGEDKDLRASAETSPDLPKNDPTEKTGPTPETHQGLSPDVQREVNSIGVELEKSGVTGGQEFEFSHSQEVNQPAMEQSESAADRYGEKSDTPPEPQPDREPDR